MVGRWPLRSTLRAHPSRKKHAPSSPHNNFPGRAFSRAAAVGKTSLLHRFVDDNFEANFISTVGIDFRDKTMVVDGHSVKLRIWDTAGQERFRTITSQFYRGSQGILLVYDCSDLKSFQNVNNWKDQIAKNADADVRTVLVANKYDLEGDAKKVAYEQGEEMAKQYGMPFFETSAKTNHNVEKAFEALAREVIEYTKLSGGGSAPATPGVELNGDAAATTKGGCCK